MDECLPIKQEHVSFLRKSAFGRTHLFMPTCTFREVKCSAPTTTRCASASVFHKHRTNDCTTRLEGSVCWHCCYDFDEQSQGFRVPRVYDPTEREYHVFGWFCSANCCKAYILEHSTFDRGYQMNIFVRMLRDVYGIVDPVIEAPPRISLRKFGGPFDIESFRAQKNVCFIMTPPFVSYSMLIEERQPIPSIGETNLTQRGTVRGLRRPASGTTHLEDSEMCNPPLAGAYQEFLRDKRACDLPVPASPREPTAKRPKAGRAPKTSHGLARFME